MTATDSLGCAGSAFPFSITVGAGTAVELRATAGTPQVGTTLTAYPVAFQAVVTDTWGNRVPGELVTFTAPSDGPSGTFPGRVLTVTVPTDAGGVVVAPTFTANGTAGTFLVTATLSGGASPVPYEVISFLPYSIPASSPAAAAGLIALLAAAAVGLLGLRRS